MLGLFLLASLAFPAGAAAITGGSDNRATATEIPPDRFNDDTTGATVQGGEDLRCGDSPYGATVWYKFTLDAPGSVKLEAHGNFDTVLSLYAASATTAEPPLCNDDTAPGSDGSEVTGTNLPAGTYFIQVGGFDSPIAAPQTGTFDLTLDMVPPNDLRAQATEVPLNSVLELQTNGGAREEPGEDLTCAGPRGDSQFGNTVWFAFTLPSRGSVTVSSQGSSFSGGVLDTVAQLYPASGPKVACNDDPPGSVGFSRIVSGELPAGRYFVQVGGFGAANSDRGNFSLSMSFTEDEDVDGDSFNRAPGPDCNDGNPGINPNATDVNYNGVDEDCRGGDDLDADNDGFNRGPDCNDANAAMSPGRREVKGNFVDENCDGKRPAARLSPTPSVLFSRVVGRTTTVRKLVISRLRKGYVIVVKCKGRGCPRKGTQRQKAKSGRITFKRFKGRKLRPGAVVTIFVTRPGRNLLGQFFRYRVLANKIVDPKEGCLVPGKLTRRKCS